MIQYPSNYTRSVAHQHESLGHNMHFVTTNWINKTMTICVHYTIDIAMTPYRVIFYCARRPPKPTTYITSSWDAEIVLFPFKKNILQRIPPLSNELLCMNSSTVLMMKSSRKHTLRTPLHWLMVHFRYFRTKMRNTEAHLGPEKYSYCTLVQKKIKFTISKSPNTPEREIANSGNFRDTKHIIVDSTTITFIITVMQLNNYDSIYTKSTELMIIPICQNMTGLFAYRHRYKS